MDGIPEAHNMNRVFPGGRGSWKEVDKVLNLFTPFIYFWFNKRIPDPFRIRLTFTPETMKFLADSVVYLASKSISKVAFINLMPANPHEESWKRLYKRGVLEAILQKELKKVAKYYIKKMKQNKPFNFCINECLIPEWSDFTNSFGLKKIPYCVAGIDKLGVSVSGKIYPCYLFAAKPEKNEEFCMGDIFNGFKSPHRIAKICNKFKQNKAFSCLYWNYKENGNPNEPALIFRILYQNWREAVLMIRNSSIYKN